MRTFCILLRIAIVPILMLSMLVCALAAAELYMALVEGMSSGDNFYVDELLGSPFWTGITVAASLAICIACVFARQWARRRMNELAV
ncbi:hypothetical protein [Arenimonas sp.]|uniref:hypothetical protein n=1 Tax=Arenimonas sp. TaxID=1872635 RepID=UPI0039E3C7D6